MASNIVLKTYAAGDNNQGSVTPQNDALIYQAAVPMNGLFFGGTITLSSANVLHVAAGMGIIGGRFFEVLENEIAVQLSASGDLLGRLYIHLDLSNADNPIEIKSYTGASLPALTGDPNLNVSSGAFDMELCTFDINELTISNIVNKFPTITAANNQVRRATAYSVNDFVMCQSADESLIFFCTTAGTTAVSEPTAYKTVTNGNTVTDGTAVFKAYSLKGVVDNVSSLNQALTTLEGTIAPILTSLVAPTGGLSKDNQFYYNGLLYKATANIAQGGTIVIGSGGNAVLADCVTEQIKGLLSSLHAIKENITPATGVQFYRSVYFLIGNVAFISVYGKFTANITGTSLIVTFPYKTKETIDIPVTLKSGGNGSIYASQNSNTFVRNEGAFSANEEFWINGFYIIAEGV